MLGNELTIDLGVGWARWQFVAQVRSGFFLILARLSSCAPAGLRCGVVPYRHCRSALLGGVLVMSVDLPIF